MEKCPITLSPTSKVETRKFERITGIPCVWIPEYHLLIAGRGGIFSKCRKIKDALRSLLAKNLDRIRNEYMEEQKGHCFLCGKFRPLHLHHIKHRSKSRDDRKENLQLVCYLCHNVAHGL